jgi:hypothetical protein
VGAEADRQAQAGRPAVSLLEPVLAEPATADDFARQAAERVTPLAEYYTAKLFGGLEVTRPVEGVELALLPSRYAPDEYGLMPSGPPPADLLSKEQFDSSIHKRPGLEWEEGETVARAAARAAVHDRQAYNASLVERSDAGWLGQTVGGLITLGTAALDPTNYIPLIGPASKAAMVARFGRVGGALLGHGTDAALNTGLFEPLTATAAQAEGRSYGWREAGSDILMNALGGAVLGTAVGEAARALGFGHGAGRDIPTDIPGAPEAPRSEAGITGLAEPPGGAPAPEIPEATPEIRDATSVATATSVAPATSPALGPPLRVDDLMRRADAADLALDQIERGEPVDVGRVLANDPALRRAPETAPEPAPVPRRSAAGEVAVATEDVAITSAGRRVPVAYEVVEAHTLVASHTEDMRVNPAFPAELQPRDRTRAASGLQVGKMASNLEPALLGRSATADSGAPIVGPDGVVESGNARVLAIGKAFRERQPGSAAYRRFLVEEGHPEAAGMEAPVLVRRRTGAMTPDERAAFAREANVSGVAAMGTAERAAADAAALKPEHLEMLASSDMHAAANRPFVRAFMAGVPPAERAGLLTADGALSRAGAERIRNAVLARAYGDADLVARLAEEPESGLGTLGRAMQDVAPTWARMRAEAAAGNIAPEGDGTAALLEAVHAITAARDAGNPLHFALGQGDLFEAAGSSLTADGRAFLTAMLTLDKKGGSRLIGAQKLGELLGRYVDAARKQPPGTDMFGEEPKTPAELLVALGRVTPEIGAPLRRGDLGARAVKIALTSAKDGQPSRTLDGLYENAEANQERLVAAGHAVAEATGTQFLNPKVKARAKSEEKIERKGYKDARQLTDVVRGGFLVRTASQAEAVVRELAKRLVLLDEGWTRTDAGYFDGKLIARLPDGTLAEVQLLEPSLYEAKETKGHFLYDEAERLPKDDPRRAELLQQQRALYDPLLAEVDPSIRGMVETPPAPLSSRPNRLRSTASEQTRPLSTTSPEETFVQPSPGASTAQPRQSSSTTAGLPSQSKNLRPEDIATSTESIGPGGTPVRVASPEELARRHEIMEALYREGIVTREEMTLPPAAEPRKPEPPRPAVPELPDAEARQLLAEEQTLGGGGRGEGRYRPSAASRARLDEIERLLPIGSEQRWRLRNEFQRGVASDRSNFAVGQRRGRTQGGRALPGDASPRGGVGMSLATAAREPVPPTLAEAAPRVGKAVPEIEALKADAKLEGYEKPLPGHEPKPEPAEKAAGEPAKPEKVPTAQEKAAAMAALPPELQEIEHMRREGVLRPEAEATLAEAEAAAQRAEGYASAWQALASCVLRNAV